MTSPNVYQTGATAALSSVYNNVSGVPFNPTTVTLFIESPGGQVTSQVFGVSGSTIVNPSSGVFSAPLLVDQAGTWNYKFVGAFSGVTAAGEGTLVGVGYITPP